MSASTPEKAGIHVYPNPVNDVLTLASTNGSSESFIIRDLTGKIVFQSQTRFENDSFNIAELKPSVFNISFEKDGQLTAESIVKV